MDDKIRQALTEVSAELQAMPAEAFQQLLAAHRSGELAQAMTEIADFVEAQGQMSAAPPGRKHHPA